MTKTISYGPSPSQVGDLYLPEGDGPFPVVLLLHGGYWTALFDRYQMVPLAEDLVTHGYAVWNVEYRRLGEDGAGWRGTFLDVAAAVDALADLSPAVDPSRVLVVGHSAGGHLAGWVAHRSLLPSDAPGANPRVIPLGAVSLAGILDLAAGDADRAGHDLTDPNTPPPAGAPVEPRADLIPAVSKLLGEGAINALLGGHSDSVPDRYAVTSPAELDDSGVPLLVIHGTADDVVPPRYSRDYVAAKGADAKYVEIPGANHFDVINPATETWKIARPWLADRLPH
ncbi:alpha/beta hydrolase [Kibdelosporangium philippinense]|uniref:Alpha/beta hydrolase n=1 Tax=Kibdelosporangium philippinense TaxID=211113 RepID=A0ABS8ZMR9_9PSEU|nr:alpha/beta hydrolase [Kibdelosporangium philippinense]MCE7008827.1 alpha/beta hydrolase [Kibdelosporangium philippinense]